MKKREEGWCEPDSSSDESGDPESDDDDSDSDSEEESLKGRKKKITTKSNQEVHLNPEA